LKTSRQRGERWRHAHLTCGGSWHADWMRIRCTDWWNSGLEDLKGG